MVALGFFDFSIDYIQLLPVRVRELCQDGKLRVLFYYHEGDNPSRQKLVLDRQCQSAGLDPDCYRFVTGNTAVAELEQFRHFADHELFYYKANHRQPALAWHDHERSRTFTLLNRTHKWWRATVTSDLLRRGVLDRSYWSYGIEDCGDQPTDNPIEVDLMPGLAQEIQRFLAAAPYRCDDLDSTQHNRHHNLVPEHFTDSYFHIVTETHFDADGSGGTFLTEKTFKPIKHAQPFVLIAPPGSLSLLRDLGYRVFDSVLDNSYDTIVHNTDRWCAVRDLLISIHDQDPRALFRACRDDVLHNQEHFLKSKHDRLVNLKQSLHH